MNVAVTILNDTTAPILTEIIPVPTPTDDNTPSYTFSSTEAGTISYGGDCSSLINLAEVGNNAITFNSLADGTYSNCSLTVTDSYGNISDPLLITPFTIDTNFECTEQDYEYGPWSSCMSNNTQTRTFTQTGSCEGGFVPGEAQLTQSCTYVPTCTENDFSYGPWSSCMSNNTQTRTFTQTGNCEGGFYPGSEQLTQTWTYIPPTEECTENDFSYGDWGECTSDSLQTRTFTQTGNCEGGFVPGEAQLTQQCTYIPPIPECTENDFEYGPWGECINGEQTRDYETTILCAGGVAPIIFQQCNIELPTCTSQDYSQPTSWDECIEGSQSGTGTKQNECNGPETWTFTQSCQAELPDCTENDYTIGDWGTCLSTGMRYRTVVLDNTECVVPEVQPATSEQCTYNPPSGGGGGGGYPFWLFQTPTNPVVPQVLGEKIGGIRYVKSPDISTVFLVDENNVRNPYPIYHVWESYFGRDYSSVEIISQNNILQYLLGKNIFFKVGSLMKVKSDPKIYQVAENGVLHWIKSEETAKRLFGDNWAKLVYDLSEVFFGDYTIGDPIE